MKKKVSSEKGNFAISYHIQFEKILNLHDVIGINVNINVLSNLSEKGEEENSKFYGKTFKKPQCVPG